MAWISWYQQEKLTILDFKFLMKHKMTGWISGM